MRKSSAWIMVLGSAALIVACFAVLRMRRPSAVSAEVTPREPERAVAEAPAVPAVARPRVDLGAHHGVDDFLTEVADRSTRFARSTLAQGALHVGFYADGLVRIVDPAGRCYQGSVQGGLARMREHNGTGTFDVRIGADESMTKIGSFHGGPYDGLTLVFEEDRERA